MSDDAERDRYRAASDLLDERPSDATRAAILAAAARNVQSRPRDAAKPMPTRRASMRWPWAAVATVLISTLAVMMATQTEREMPTFSAPPSARPAPQSADRPAASDSSNAASPATPATPSVAASREPAAAVVAERPSEPPADSGSTGTAQPAPSRAKRAAPSAEAPAQRAAAPQSPPMEEKVEAKQEMADQRANATSSASGAAARGGLMKEVAPAAKPDSAASSLERQRDERVDALRSAPAAARTPPAPSPALGASPSDGAREADLSADQWLQKIIALRAAGRDEEADVELRRFRERYPQVQVPPAALRASGTR